MLSERYGVIGPKPPGSDTPVPAGYDLARDGRPVAHMDTWDVHVPTAAVAARDRDVVATARAWWGQQRCLTIPTACAEWNCSCQHMSDKYGISHRDGNGGVARRPQIMFWNKMNCE